MQVYLDNAATTPLHPKVFEKMKPYLNEDFGNPSSIHSYGRKVRVAIEEARETIAGIINANPSEIYFTSGGTEANNFAVRGIAGAEYKESGNKRIITSKSEHHCVMDVFNDLADTGFDSHFVNIDRSSIPDLNEIESSIDENTSLLSIIHINNETGAVNDIPAISKLCKTK